MKSNKILKAILGLMVSFAIVSCVQDDDYTVPSSLGNEENAKLQEVLTQIDNGTMQLLSIDEIKDIYDDYLDGIPNGVFDYDKFFQITSNVVVKGYVSSSDQSGNLYKEFYIQDAPENPTSAIAVQINLVDSYSQFNQGREVYVVLKDMYVGENSSEVIALGGKPDDDEVGQFTGNQYPNQILRSTTSETIVPLELAISEINANNVGMLVKISNAQFPSNYEGLTYFDASEDFDTQRLIESCEGFGYSNFILETSSFSNFTNFVMPTEGGGSITGIITQSYGGDDIVMALNTEADVMFNDSRCTPLNMDDFEVIVEEDFNTAVDGTDLDLPGWTNFAEEGSRVWREEAYGGNGYAEFSTYGAPDDVNIAWLVSPGIDMDMQDDEFLNFTVAQHHLDSPDNTFEAFVSSDFDGTDVLGATWEPISVTLPTQATPWYNFVNSGLVDISAYTGTLHVAFKVTGSGTDEDLDGAYQLDDFSILGSL